MASSVNIDSLLVMTQGMTYIRHTMTVLTLPLLLTGLFGFAPIVSAAEETCDCWCESKAGATREPAGSEKLLRSDCSSRCQEKYPGYGVAVCAISSDQLPSQNVSCFTADQCTNQKGRFDTKFQPPECMAGSRYCYPDQSTAAKVTLSTSIAGLTVTGDLGEYIAKVYQWMIGSATLIAIVLIMVSGLRWTLGGLSAEQVNKAKKTISNSIVGLVLLLGTYLILFTVNPQLLKLQVPSFPMIRQVALVGAGTSCGYLTGKNPYGTRYEGSPYGSDAPPPKGGHPYELDDSGHLSECGAVSKILKDWEGNEVAEGSTCVWDSCRTDAERCLPKSGGQGDCVTCKDIVNDNPFLLEPNAKNCSMFSLPDTGTPDKPLIRQCIWTRDEDFVPGADITGSSCAFLTINCAQITKCEDYDTLATVENVFSGLKDLESIQFAGPQNTLGLANVDYGNASLLTVCAKDPCSIAPEGKRCWAKPIVSILSQNDCKTVDSTAAEGVKEANQ